MTATVYRNLTVLEGDALRIRTNAALVIDGGRILEISDRRRGDGIDLRGAVAIPAFVDAHTHLADHGVKDAAIGRPTVEAVSPPTGLKYRYLAGLSDDELVASLGMAIDEALACGVVACGDFREGGADGVRALRRASVGRPFRAIAYGDATVLPTDGAYGQQLSDVLDVADGIGVGDIARFDNRRIAELERRFDRSGKRLAVHAAETVDAQAACVERWGESEVVRILRANPDLLVHLTRPKPGDLDAIADRAVPVVCCARTNAILADGLPPIAEMVDRAIPLSLGTDNMMFTGPDMFREMDWFSRLARGAGGRADAIDSAAVLRCATSGGARALGLADELGTLAPGKAACFVVLDADSINLRGTRDLHAALVHRAGVRDIVQVVAWGEDVPIGRER